jgi:hypothetical protein
LSNKTFINGQYLYGPDCNSWVQYCATIAALRTFVGKTTDGTTITVRVLGGAALGDGGGGAFYWSATSTAADNGTTVVKPTAIGTGTGRWLITPASGFGVAIDGVTIRVNGLNQLYVPGGATFSEQFVSGTVNPVPLTATVNDVWVDTTVGVAALALPAAGPSANGTTVVISDYNLNANVNPITISVVGGGTIGAGTSWVVNTQGGGIQAKVAGSVWAIVGTF